MTALGNGAPAMQVEPVETRSFQNFGYDVGKSRPGPNGVPVYDVAFATPLGIIYLFPMDRLGLANLKARIDKAIEGGDAD